MALWTEEALPRSLLLTAVHRVTCPSQTNLATSFYVFLWGSGEKRFVDGQVLGESLMRALPLQAGPGSFSLMEKERKEMKPPQRISFLPFCRRAPHSPQKKWEGRASSPSTSLQTLLLHGHVGLQFPCLSRSANREKKRRSGPQALLNFFFSLSGSWIRKW
jgi:hypothetical protein